MPETRTVPDLEQAIDELLAEGYRLDMIMPADAPRKASLSRGEEHVEIATENPQSQIPNPKSRGRAGMEYRDLIPDRLGGRVIASHIRIVEGGEVPDYVHYHKVFFQMIFCRSGWVRVVYEDQGPPFVLEAGDCVLQPPGIRHRVLEASAGAEVIEISAPADHETWVDHEMKLPTRERDSNREFNGQFFVHHKASEAHWAQVSAGCRVAVTNVEQATHGEAKARILKVLANGYATGTANGKFLFACVLSGSFGAELHPGNCFTITDGSSYHIPAFADSELLEVELRMI